MTGRVETQVIRTARLKLRSPRRNDAPAVAEALRDFEVTRWLTQVPYPYGLSDAEAFLRAPEPGTWIIEDDMGLAGMFTVNFKLGYWLVKRVWGNRYVAEALAPVLTQHYQDPEAADIISGCMSGNARSLAILTRLGFRADGEERITPRSTGREIELPMYRLTRRNWCERYELP